MIPTPMPPTILVVDDDPGLLILIESALRAEKWNVATATSGADALAWLQENSADLLLLDLKLHDIEGRQVISALAGANCSVPFIIVTGQGDERVAVEMMKRGALDYVVKDVNFVEFLPTIVRRALEHIQTSGRLTAVEEALGKSEALKQAVMHSLTTHVAVLSESGNIIAVNDAWNRFSRENGNTGLPRTGVGANFLDACRRAAAPGLSPASEALAGIQAVLAGSKETFSMEYDCHSPDQERWFVMSVTNFGGASAGAVVSHTDITERRRLESELLNSIEHEQRRFGHDLHDGLGQRLTGLEMLSHGLAEDLKSHAPVLAKQARRLNQELRETVTQARLISHSLAPVPLEGDGLMRGLMELAVSTSRIPGIACRLACDPPVCIQDVTTATHLYRIAQEAVNNAVKHGRAKKICITLAEQAGGLKLSVENNGRPIPTVRRSSTGIGLNVMRYRAGIIGASLSIESGKRKDVSVTCILSAGPILEPA